MYNFISVDSILSKDLPLGHPGLKVKYQESGSGSVEQILLCPPTDEEHRMWLMLFNHYIKQLEIQKQYHKNQHIGPRNSYSSTRTSSYTSPYSTSNPSSNYSSISNPRNNSYTSPNQDNNLPSPNVHSDILSTINNNPFTNPNANDNNLYNELRLQELISLMKHDIQNLSKKENSDEIEIFNVTKMVQLQFFIFHFFNLN